MRVCLITHQDNKSWNDLVSNHFKGSIYFNMRWLKAMENNSGMKLQLLAVHSNNNNIIPMALFPLFVLKKWPLKAAFSPAPGCDTPYLGALYDPDLLNNKNRLIIPDIQSAIGEYLWDQGFNFIKILLSPGQMDNRGFNWGGFQIRQKYEYVLDISCSAEELFQKIPRDTRTKIRRAQKYKKLEFIFGGHDNASEISCLIRNRFEVQGIKWPVKESFIKELFKDLHPSNVHALLARFEGRPVGGMIFFKYKNSLNDWIGGVNPIESVSGLNELLHWKIIMWGKTLKCDTYNLGGANTMHLCKPKLKFNPELNPYFELLQGSHFYKLINNTAALPGVRKLLHAIR